MTLSKQMAENAISGYNYYRTEAEYYDNAPAVVAGEPNSDRLKVEYLDSDGQVRFSLQPDGLSLQAGTPDIHDAISMKRTKVSDRRRPQHRRAHHGRLQPAEGRRGGRWVMRYVTSLNQVDRQISSWWASP